MDAMDAPADLDRLANLLGAATLAAADRLRTAVEDDLGVGGAAPAALVHLLDYPGESAEALRQVLGITQPAAARAIDRLAAEGLLERRTGPDRRTHALHLTAAGRRRTRRLLAQRTGALRGLLDRLAPAEQERLLPLLESLVAGLADDRPQALRVCRLCDRRACCREPGCPLDHTTRTER